MKKLTNFLKSKKGDVIEAILVIPIFITMLIFIGYQMDFHKTRNAVEDANRIVSRYIMSASTMEDAINSANTYLANREDNFYFTIDNNETKYFTIENIKKMHIKEKGGYRIITDKEEMIDSWKNGNYVEFEFTRKTSYYNLTFNEFCPVNPQIVGGERTCFKLLQDRITSSNVVILEGSVGK